MRDPQADDPFARGLEDEVTIIEEDEMYVEIFAFDD